MRKMRAFWMRVFGLFDRSRTDNEISAELESHVALDTKKECAPVSPPKKLVARRSSVSAEQSKRARPTASAPQVPLAESVVRRC